MLKKSKNSFQSLDEIKVSSKTYKIFNLKKAEQNGLEGISKLPKSLKVLLENLRDFGSFEIPSRPFCSAFFKLNIL